MILFGEYGKGIKHLARLYKRVGIKHITVQLYKHKRHEILFEEDYLKTWQHTCLNGWKSKF